MKAESVVTTNDTTIEWLIGSTNPSVRFLTLKDLLGEPADSAEVREAQKRIPQSTFVTSFFAGQQPDSGFGVHPYMKWTGAHWRLVSLSELGYPPGDPRVAKMANQALEWLASSKHRDPIKKIEGRVRAHTSMEGNGLMYSSRLGLGEDPRLRLLADSLVEWQWPDGGWNCDPRPEADHSSFNESLIPLIGLVEYEAVIGRNDYRKTIERATEFLLKHQLYKSCTSGRVVKEEFLELHYPAYWHYGVLEGLLAMSRVGRLDDPRTKDALDYVVRKRGADGKWTPDTYYYLKPGEKARPVEFGEDYSEPPMPEVVDWGRAGPSEMLTLNAARILKKHLIARIHP